MARMMVVITLLLLLLLLLPINTTVHIMILHSGNPWECEKPAVIQETRIFNSTPIDTVKCCKLITKVGYITLLLGHVMSRL